MKLHTTVNFILACLISSLLMIAPSCKKEIEGCTDPNSLNFNPDADTNDGSCLYLQDKVIGDWEVLALFINENDGVAFGLFKSITFAFGADGNFEWNAIPTNGVRPLAGSGEWEVDGDFLETDFAPNSDTFCGDDDHRFSIDFDGDDVLNLEDRCNSGSNVKIELNRN